MASDEQVASLRAKTAAASSHLNDLELDDRIDAAGGDVDLAAARVWEEYAASTAELVDVSESGSSRSLSGIHQNALKMAAAFRQQAPGYVDLRTRSRTRPIARP